MGVPQQADADPVEVVLAWLKNHPQVGDLLGGPDHATGLMEAPWPHLVVGDGTGGDLRDFRWDAELEVAFDLYSHPNGAPGTSAMRKILMRVLRVVADLPEEQVVTDETPVVSRVRPAGTYSWQPLTNGQLRVSSSVYVTIHPPKVVPDP